MKTFRLFLLALLLPAFVLMGCGETPDDPEKGGAQIELPDDTESTQTAFADEKTTGSFTFTAKAPWTALVTETTRAVSWLRLLSGGKETYSGEAGTFTLTIELDENYTGATRSATITITVGTDKITITVTQNGTTEDGKVPEYPDDPDDTQGVLINGVAWATANVDAPGTFAAKPEDSGMFYQWGKKVGWSSTDPLVSSNGDTTWDEIYFSGDVWESANDPCPAGWRVPSREDYEALCDKSKVSNTWTKQGGVDGRLFVDAKTEKSIFLPAAGFRYFFSGALSYVGSLGYYWSDTPSSATNGYDLYFDAGTVDPSGSGVRDSGFAVRCVSE